MPRNPKVVAISRLAQKREKWDRSRALAAAARDELDEAIRGAHLAGLTATDIGHRVGVSRTRVMQVVQKGHASPSEA